MDKKIKKLETDPTKNIFMGQRENRQFIIAIIGNVVVIIAVLLAGILNNKAWNQNFWKTRKARLVDKIYDNYVLYQENCFEYLRGLYGCQAIEEYILLYNELENRKELDKWFQIDEGTSKKIWVIQKVYLTQDNSKDFLLNEHEKCEEKLLKCAIKVYSTADYLKLYLTGTTIEETIDKIRNLGPGWEEERPAYLKIQDTEKMIKAFRQSIEKKINSYDEEQNNFKEYFKVIHKELNNITIQ